VYNRPIDQQQQQPPPQQQHQQETPRIQPPVQQIPIAQQQEVVIAPTLPSTPQAKGKLLFLFFDLIYNLIFIISLHFNQ